MLTRIATWIAALLIGAAPLAISIDSGGVLPWSHWAAAVIVLVAGGAALVASLATPSTVGLRAHALSLLLLAATGYGLLQLIPLPEGLLRIVSGGSAVAYHQWLGAITEAPGWNPVSLAPWLTWHAIAVTAMLALGGWVASSMFGTRPHLAWLLFALATTGAVHAVLGIYQTVNTPGQNILGYSAPGAPFGVFGCRNNAAVIMNLALAASLGLFAWRLVALTGYRLGHSRLRLDPLYDLFSDRLAIVALIAGTLSLSGVLVCGSRGGLLACVVAMIAVLGWYRSSTQGQRLGIVAVMVVLSAVILLARFEVTARSVERIEETPIDLGRFGEIDGRFRHWPDGMRAAIAHFPAGAGAGAYRYAYLPYQEASGGSWFMNADNLWLEWLVEGGVAAIVLLGLGLWIVLVSLRRLQQSVDPMDYGLAIAGSFALVAMILSQLFDFGLLHPGTALAAVLLFGAVVARSVAVGTTRRPRGKRGEPLEARETAPPRDVRPQSLSAARPWLRPLPTLATGALALAACAAALPRLHSDAEIDAEVRAAGLMLASPATSAEKLAESAQALERLAAERPDHGRLWERLSDVRVRQFRFDLALEHAERLLAEGDSDNLESRIQEAINLRRQRAAWYVSLESSAATEEAPVPADAQPMETLERGRQAALEALRAAPLSDFARIQLMKLDFAGGSPPQTQQLLQQTIELRRNNARTLSQLATLALDAGDHASAADAWRRLLVLAPGQTAGVLRRLPSDGSIQASDIVPRQVEPMTAATRWTLASQRPDRALLQTAQQVLTADLPLDSKLRSERRLLLAQVAEARRDTPEMLKQLGAAVADQPRDSELRYRYARELLNAQRFSEARQEMIVGRELEPNSSRFEELSREITRASFSQRDR